MKPIRPLAEPPPRLQSFLVDTDGPSSGWERFKDHDAGAAYRELCDALESVQRGLCAYCEIRLIATDRQVEHLLPKERFPELALAVGNLIAACRGGTNPHSPQASRKALRPSRRSCSCGQFKGERILDGSDVAQPRILKPSEIPPFPPIFAVASDGSIRADAEACRRADIAPNVASATLAELNLDCERLRNARRVVWEVLASDLAAVADDSADDDAYAAAMADCARIHLLADTDGTLGEFFTTRRSFFGAIGERLLASAENDWI